MTPTHPTVSVVAQKTYQGRLEALLVTARRADPAGREVREAGMYLIYVDGVRVGLGKTKTGAYLIKTQLLRPGTHTVTAVFQPDAPRSRPVCGETVYCNAGPPAHEAGPDDTAVFTGVIVVDGRFPTAAVAASWGGSSAAGRAPPFWARGRTAGHGPRAVIGGRLVSRGGARPADSTHPTGAARSRRGPT